MYRSVYENKRKSSDTVGPIKMKYKLKFITVMTFTTTTIMMMMMAMMMMMMMNNHDGNNGKSFNNNTTATPSR